MILRRARLLELSAVFILSFGAISPVWAEIPEIAFRSPSDNITCYHYNNWHSDWDQALVKNEGPLVCLVHEADWNPPPALDNFDDYRATCNTDQTRVITLPPDGPSTEGWVCHGDMFWPLGDIVISYGSEWSFLEYSCTVETSGVSCQNKQGNGFSVRRAMRELY
jgi:hypothetical protein